MRSANDTVEYRTNYVANEYIHGLFALDEKWTGKGILIGVIDDGVDVEHIDLKDQISGLSKDFGYIDSSDAAGRVTTVKRDSLGDASSDHGTGIAGIIAAARNGVAGMGIAPDAKLAVLRVSDKNLQTSAETFPTNNTIAALRYATEMGLKVLNRSLGTSGISQNFIEAVTVFGQGGGVLVNSAGNDKLSAPSDAINVTAANRNYWLFVGNVVPNGTSYSLAETSNRAGSLADRFLVAPGEYVTTKLGGGSTTFTGTGTAAAVATGSVALILQKWPQLSGVQAAGVLLATARDIGDPGVDPIFGRGLLDLRAALSPVEPTLSNGVRQTSLRTSSMSMPASFGTSGMFSALSDVTILDGFGRDYRVSLSNAVNRPANPHSLEESVLRTAAGQSTAVGTENLNARFDYLISPQPGEPTQKIRLGSAAISARWQKVRFRLGLNAPFARSRDLISLSPTSDVLQAYAAQARNSVSLDRRWKGKEVSVSAAGGKQLGTTVKALSLSFKTRHSGLRISAIKEKNSVFGTRSFGALQLGSGSQTVTLDGDHSFHLGSDWTLTGYASVGRTRLTSSDQSLVVASSDLIATRFGLTAQGSALGAQWALRLTQPLTIESGSATLKVGGGYDLAARALTFDRRIVNLAADQRSLQVTAGVSKNWGVGSGRFEVARELARNEAQALLHYNVRF